MTEKKGSTIISLSLPKNMIIDINKFMKEIGYTSRSELLRKAIRSFIKERARLEDCSGTIKGVITLLYNHASAAQVSTVRHRFIKIFQSFMHTDFEGSRCLCCEVLIFSGPSAKVQLAYDQLQVLKGVVESHIYIASAI